MTLVPARLRRKPHSFRHDDDYLEHLRAEAERTGSHFGIFFDTSGNARVERINDAAQYDYFWRSDINNNRGS